VTYVDDGAGGKLPLVAKGDGELDTSATGIIAGIGALRGIGGTLKTRMGTKGAAAAGGAKLSAAHTPKSANGIAQGAKE